MEKIVWLTEGGFEGKVNRNYEGMRNDSAWMCNLNATHVNITKAHLLNENYDLAIVTIPKTHIDIISQYPFIEHLRKKCHQIYVPTMGRKIKNEEHMENLNHLPYMSWVNWIKTLNQFKYGVHLMRTHAAGTFALNCAYLGIPCIGYEGLDTQEKCHPSLTVKLGDLVEAKKKIIELKNNKDWYKECSKIAKFNYKQYFHENKFNPTGKK